MWRLIRETLLRWLKISLRIVAALIITVVAIASMLIILVFGLEDDYEGPIPTPFFPDQMTATPSQMTPTPSN